MKSIPVGVIHGRFQGLHLGHMEYLLEAKKRCNFLYIGITNPDPSLTSNNDVDPKRSEKKENPFTFYERLIMVRDAMLEAGIKREEIEIVPFPINYPNLIKYYVPLDAVFFVTIYDEWGNHKKRTLESLGLNTNLMWERTMEQRFTTGKEIRKLISNDGNWERLVPNSVSKFIKENKLDERIKKINDEKI